MAIIESIEPRASWSGPSKAEEELRHRIALEKLLITVSTQLINLPGPAIDRALDDVLEQVGRAVGGEGSLVLLLSDDRSELVRRFGWVPKVEGTVASPPDLLLVAESPALMAAVTGLEPFRLDRVEDLPADGSGEREHLLAQGIRSILGIPIAPRGELLGVLTLVTLSYAREWRDDDVSLLRVVGDIFGAALARKATEEALGDATRRLEATNRELEAGSRRMALLSELGDLLQSSASCDEASMVIANLLPRILEGTAGTTFIFSADRHHLEPAAAWGDGATEQTTFLPEECWALRRGRSHRVAPGATGIVCRHVREVYPGGYVCIPLMAQGEALGVLHVRMSGRGDEPADSAVAAAAANRLALGLANLRLRERLRSQALQDPLTGLFNRRYLEDRLDREVRRARRRGLPLSLVMLDLDHFKRINDTQGHEAGDRVLQAVAEALETTLRAEDVAARYGGEEFTVLLPGTPLEEACWVAEKLRGAVGRLRVRHAGLILPGVSVSAGVAALPEDGEGDAGELLRLADAALYDAKEGGRDRLVAARVDPRAEAAGDRTAGQAN